MKEMTQEQAEERVKKSPLKTLIGYDEPTDEIVVNFILDQEVKPNAT